MSENSKNTSHDAKPLHVTIESVAFGGKGIARNNGKVLFVADSVPGDEVLVEVIEAKERYAEAKILERIKASPLRAMSPCPISTACGGCQWIDIPYPTQLEWKENFVKSSLQRIGKVQSQTTQAVVGSSLVVNYRNRVHLKARLLPTGAIEIGYFKRGSHDFIAIPACAIAHASINQLIKDLLNVVLPNSEAVSAFKLEIQQLPAASTKDLLVTIFQDDLSSLQLSALKHWLQQHPKVQWAGSSSDRDQCEATEFEKSEGITYFAVPGQFQQVNTAANQALRKKIQEKIMQLDPRRILDVYCGSGNLSLWAASETVEVFGVEANPAAIFSAQKNVQANGIQNATYFRGDGEAHLWKCAKKGERFDLVIVDPPREGMYRALVPLKKIAPRDILYISCDPSTLARDIGALCRSDYEVVDIQIFDFFPNTFHVESFIHLKRNKESK